MISPADDFVLQIAREKKLVREEHIEAAREILAHQDVLTAPPRMIDLLVEQGVLTREQIARLLGEAFHMPVADLAELRVGSDLLRLVPRTLASRYTLVPIVRTDRSLQVAICDPLDTEGVDSLAHLLRLDVQPSVAPRSEILAAIDRLYGKEESSLDALLGTLDSASAPEMGEAVTPPATPAESLDDADPDAPIVRWVHALILEAIQRRASDIHVEPLEKRFRVRYRIDGVLLEVENPPKRLQLAIVSRLKLMANISIAEKRVPQDGRIQIAMTGRSIDLRVSSLPTVHGESVVMRILDKEGLQLGLPELGFLSDDQTTFEKLIALPDGIVLVTGPTGSGKTTTLYGCLHYLNKPDRKIITVEDPVEYQLTGINQVPVRHEVGMTFASALRAMLRQAPNIVMIGEIRDVETAEIAINASLTGHMVFSTLHTNDAPGAVTRLIDIGVKPFLVSTSLRAAMAQRLVRKICLKCRRDYQPSPTELRALNFSSAQLEGARFQRGHGCPDCNGTGFRGRMGIFEIFPVNEELQRMIYEHASSARLRDRARSLGMRTMREDGARKAIAGLTTIDEVVSITVGDSS